MLILRICDVTQAEDLTKEVNSFIENTQTSGRAGGEHWPVVKQVRVYIPRCKVLKCGAVLVDLPGTRDSNAARDNIAKQVRVLDTLRGQIVLMCHVPEDVSA